MPSRTILTLLRGFIDYAGLFPPAQLSMRASAREFARLRRGKDAWMLGRFIVPVTYLDDLEAAAKDLWPREPNSRPWVLSVVIVGSLVAARKRIDAFNRAHAAAGAGRAVIESVELKPADADDIARAARAFERLKIFYELAHDRDPGPLMAAVATLGGRAKIRTGGATAADFPTSAEVARFLCAAERASIPFKATAGLHHALRGEHPLTDADGSPEGAMHGLLNVLLAAAWIKTAGMGQAEVEELLEERSQEAISFTDGEVGWRDRRLSLAAIVETRRTFAVSCGSCSFKEPVSDLRSLKLL